MSTPETTPEAPARPVTGPSPWPWMAVACLLLAGSGAIRIYHERSFDAAAQAAETPPFPMRDLPTALGPWHMQGPERELPKETLEIAGSTDYMAREYVNERTGVRLSGLVVFGPAERVFPHAPTVCFPAFGYDVHQAAKPQQITTPDGRQVLFHRLVYAKPNGATTEYVEVFYSFRHADHWSPEAEQTRKQFRHRPDMFKVQVQRPTRPGEQDDAIKEFLAELVARIEQRLAEAPTPRG